MSTATINIKELKAVLKSAVNEVLDERLEEVLEDIGLARAMDEAKRSPLVPREKIFSILKSKP